MEEVGLVFKFICLTCVKDRFPRRAIVNLNHV